MLAIQKYLHKNGLDKTIKDLNLRHKVYPDGKIILKYQMYDYKTKAKADWSIPALHECRGIILDKNFNVISLGLTKFFNLGETYAANINWRLVSIYPKLDGSFTQLYYYNNTWNVGTTGTAEGEGEVNSVNTTFANLFWKAFAESNGIYENLDRNVIYMFELMTPDNIIVVPHETYSLTMLAARNQKTLVEYSHDVVTVLAAQINIDVVVPLIMENVTSEKLVELTKQMSKYEEGFVVSDGNGRIKIKSPAYVDEHHLKSDVKPSSIINIFKKNEFEEWIVTRKGDTDHYIELYFKWIDLVNILKDMYDYSMKVKPSILDNKSNALFHSRVINKFGKIPICDNSNRTIAKFMRLAHNVRDGVITDIDGFVEYVNNIDNKTIYNIFKTKSKK